MIENAFIDCLNVCVNGFMYYSLQQKLLSVLIQTRKVLNNDKLITSGIVLHTESGIFKKGSHLFWILCTLT